MFYFNRLPESQTKTKKIQNYNLIHSYKLNLYRKLSCTLKLRSATTEERILENIEDFVKGIKLRAHCIIVPAHSVQWVIIRNIIVAGKNTKQLWYAYRSCWYFNFNVFCEIIIIVSCKILSKVHNFYHFLFSKSVNKFGYFCKIIKNANKTVI